MADPIYSDINPFKPLEEANETDLQAVLGSVYNNFNVSRTEVLFDVEIGGDWDELLEIPIDEASELVVLTEVSNTLEDNDPRISVDQSGTEITPSVEKRKYDVDVVLDIKGLNEKGLVYSGSFSQ